MTDKEFEMESEELSKAPGFQAPLYEYYKEIVEVSGILKDARERDKAKAKVVTLMLIYIDGGAPLATNEWLKRGRIEANREEFQDREEDVKNLIELLGSLQEVRYIFDKLFVTGRLPTPEELKRWGRDEQLRPGIYVSTIARLLMHYLHIHEWGDLKQLKREINREHRWNKKRYARKAKRPKQELENLFVMALFRLLKKHCGLRQESTIAKRISHLLELWPQYNGKSKRWDAVRQIIRTATKQ